MKKWGLRRGAQNSKKSNGNVDTSNSNSGNNQNDPNASPSAHRRTMMSRFTGSGSPSKVGSPKTINKKHKTIISSVSDGGMSQFAAGGSPETLQGALSLPTSAQNQGDNGLPTHSTPGMAPLVLPAPPVLAPPAPPASPAQQVPVVVPRELPAPPVRVPTVEVLEDVDVPAAAFVGYGNGSNIIGDGNTGNGETGDRDDPVAAAVLMVVDDDDCDYDVAMQLQRELEEEQQLRQEMEEEQQLRDLQQHVQLEQHHFTDDTTQQAAPTIQMNQRQNADDSEPAVVDSVAREVRIATASETQTTPSHHMLSSNLGNDANLTTSSSSLLSNDELGLGGTNTNSDFPSRGKPPANKAKLMSSNASPDNNEYRSSASSDLEKNAAVPLWGKPSLKKTISSSFDSFAVTSPGENGLEIAANNSSPAHLSVLSGNQTDTNAVSSSHESNFPSSYREYKQQHQENQAGKEGGEGTAQKLWGKASAKKLTSTEPTTTPSPSTSSNNNPLFGRPTAKKSLLTDKPHNDTPSWTKLSPKNHEKPDNGHFSNQQESALPYTQQQPSKVLNSQLENEGMGDNTINRNSNTMLEVPPFTHTDDDKSARNREQARQTPPWSRPSSAEKSSDLHQSESRTENPTPCANSTRPKYAPGTEGQVIDNFEAKEDKQGASIRGNAPSAQSNTQLQGTGYISETPATIDENFQQVSDALPKKKPPNGSSSVLRLPQRKVGQTDYSLDSVSGLFDNRTQGWDTMGGITNEGIIENPSFLAAYNNMSSSMITHSFLESPKNVMKGKEVTDSRSITSAHDSRSIVSEPILRSGDSKRVKKARVRIMADDGKYPPPDLPKRKNVAAAKLPSTLSDENDSSSSSDMFALPAKKNDASFAALPVAVAVESKMTVQGSAPLWGKKAKKNASLEDEPDVREIAFAEGSGGLNGLSHQEKREGTSTFGSAANNRYGVSSNHKEDTQESIDEKMPTILSVDSYKNSSESNSSDPKDEAKGKLKGESVFASGIDSSFDHLMWNAQASSSRLDFENLSEEEMLRRAILASQEEPIPSANRLTQIEIEDAKENVRTIRSLLNNDDVDVVFLQTVLSMCKIDQKRIAQDVEHVMMNPDDGGVDPSKLEMLMELNYEVIEVIEAGEQIVQDDQKKPAATVNRVSLDVEELVRKKDVFSLICMLRVQDKTKRLETSTALMMFARSAEKEGGAENARLRNEICSSGGLHSLLTLFRARDTLYEVKVVSALAVAYLLPAIVESSSSTTPSLGLKIVECLRFLVTNPRPVSPCGVAIEVDEMYRASAMGLTTFWVNQMEPMLISKKTASMLMSAHNEADENLDRNVSLGGRLRGGRSANGAGGAVFDQRQEEIALDELLDMAVSLIIRFAKKEKKVTTGPTGLVRNVSVATVVVEESATYAYTLIEQLCAVEVARPIAVRAGILQILVSWIQSSDRDKIRPATSALRYLTSITDKYMAGWIHSEMVNKGAVKCLADLTHNISVTHDVRVAIVQILSSLCAAPHTRAAVVDENCVSFLIGFLFEHTGDEVALYAGKAILQLAEGAITRASAFREHELDFSSCASSDKRDSLIGDIVESGVIASFVSIALNGHGKVRLVAVNFLKVISEDTSTNRKTRLHLCEDSAALALGSTLKDDIKNVGYLLREELADISSKEQHFLKELHAALYALANILDPVLDSHPPGGLLVKVCLETAQSGGLEALLSIASSPFLSLTKPFKLWPINTELIEEACRSLALLSPMLLHPKVISEGYSRFSHDLLVALHHVLKQITSSEFIAQNSDRAVDLFVNVLQGISALAGSDPLKVLIIDTSLPNLLQAKGVRDPVDVSNAAGQAFQSLGFAEDEVAVHLAGNNPNVLADWFCLQRSLLIQAMARAEIRQLIMAAWAEPFQLTPLSKTTKLLNESSLSAGDGKYLFKKFADDLMSLEERESLLNQYKDIYEGRLANNFFNEVSVGLLARQIYPLNSSSNEKNWILNHGKCMVESMATNFSQKSFSNHVEKLLGYCFPSRLLLDHVVPVSVLQPESSFNFRAFMMPQRRYFSFRREGQLLSQLCDKELADMTDLESTLGTLVFTNSSFDSEFPESLVQELYLCPMIIGLSFAKNTDSPDLQETESESKESQTDDRSNGFWLASLVGSVPPWITHLTFDGLFDDQDMATFVCVLKAIENLAVTPDANERAPNNQAKSRGNFFFLAIRNSPNITENSWSSLFNLLGPFSKPLSPLRILDLSGNKLGDPLCALLLEVILTNDSNCCVEKLDLSDNAIGGGETFVKALWTYCHGKMKTYNSDKKRNSPLATLRLASNDLHRGKAWLELLSLLENDGLKLTTLDLSNNDLDVRNNEASIIAEALFHNSTLCDLNLSGNRFSEKAIDTIVRRLAGNDYILTMIAFDNNLPALTRRQVSELHTINLNARRNAIVKYHYETEEVLVVDDAAEPDTTDPVQNKDMREWYAGVKTVPKKPIAEETVKPGDNMITVLFSAPLVFTDGKQLRPFAKLDFDMERELMWQCLKEASRDIELMFDSATHDRLLATMTKRCSCLHYSGHGHEQYLPFEDGKGGPHWVNVEKFEGLIAKEGGPPFRFVFVSACHSYLAGETFASAGVPHVVCCQQESELKDTAALAFTRQFYLSLSIGHTVRESFEQGCKAVRATPNLKNADQEMRKFLLLPENGNHDVAIFNAKFIPEWPKPVAHEESMMKSRRSVLKGGKTRGGARASELSVRNMMQEDPSPSPPQFFLGREVDMYYVLRAVLEKRLVSIIGEPGVGRSSLACALCHYINERASTIITIEHIYFVRARRSRKNNPFKALVVQFLNKLYDDENKYKLNDDADMETLFDDICDFLKPEKALIVFDRAEIVVDADEANEFPMLLSKLCRDTKNVKVLLTNRYSLGIPSLGEHPITLGPLNFAETVRLFSKNCPFIHTPADRRRCFDSLVSNPEEGELLATDPGIGFNTRRIFDMIGEGIPAKIEKAAYNLTKEEYLGLLSGRV